MNYQFSKNPDDVLNLQNVCSSCFLYCRKTGKFFYVGKYLRSIIVKYVDFV